MLLDSITRRDLELFRTRSGDPGIFDLLNLTLTRGGSAALRSRFENPLSDLVRIQDIQDGIAFLLSRGTSFPIRPALMEEVTRYLDSSWDVVAKSRGLLGWLEAMVVSLRYRPFLRFAREGAGATERLILELQPFLEDLLEEDPPTKIRHLGERLLAITRELELGPDHWRRNTVLVLRVDRYLRREEKDHLLRLLELLSDLDALLAMAQGMKRFGLAFPELVDSSDFVLEGEGIFHLFLEDPVRNPLNLGDGRKVLFLTGPNMAGKTTYLKAVAVAVYLAHLGMGVPATRLRLAPLDALFTSLTPEENIRAGLSYFMAEVRRVRDVAAALAEGSRALVVFDEIFRGTNVKDAFEASLLVIRGFARNPRCGFLFSSHLVELAPELSQEAGIVFSSFRGQIREGRATYGFHLEDGVSDQRFGMLLLEEERVPELLEESGPKRDGGGGSHGSRS